MSLPAPPHLVCAAWLRSRDELSPYVSTADISQSLGQANPWTTGYAITCSLITPNAHLYGPLRFPTVQVDVWGKSVSTKGGTRLPWNTCAEIAELIADLTYESEAPGVLDIGSTVYPVRITDVALVRAAASGPKADKAAFARASLEVQITYVPVYSGV